MLRSLGTILAAAALLAASPAFAQRITGNLVGTASDESGAVLPGVSVSLTGETIVGAQSTVTNEAGFYRLIALPPGSYEVSFALAGFVTLRRQGVRVAVGATEELGVALKVSPRAEEVTVVGDSPIVDTQTNQVSTNYDEDWVRNAPIARFSMFDLIAPAPGVSQSTFGQASMVFGSGADENSYQFDGTELTSSAVGGAWPWPNTDAIQEVEVLTLGAPAEYGNVAGGVFNVVTRQGSNQFHGDLNFYIQTDGLTASNTTDAMLPNGTFADACSTEDDPNRRCPFHRERFHDATAQLSGPILKDKLWFFVSYQYQRDYTTPVAVDPRLFGRFETDRIFGKLNWQISPRHKLAFGLHNDYLFGAGSPAPNSSPSNASRSHGDNPTPNLMYTGILSDKTVVEARLAGFFGDFHLDPLLEDQPRIQPVFYDLDTGQYSGGIGGWGDQKHFQQGATVKVSHFADDFLGGSHDFRFGVQQVRGGVDDALYGYNDFILTYRYTDDSGNSDQRAYGYQYQPYSFGGTTAGVGAFLDDAFRVSSRLTLNLGLRYDHNRAGIPDLLVRDQAGDPTGEVVPSRHLYSTDTFSPRVGFNLKLTPDGRTVLRGHYGRYYRRVVVGEFAANIGISPNETRAGVYDLTTGTFVDPAVTEFSQNVGVGPGYTIPHTDQFVAGLERELGRDLGLSLHYVHKRSRGFSAWQDVQGRYEDVVYVDDQGVDASGRSIVVQRLLTDPADRFFEQQNPPQMKTSAHALSAQATKRLSRGWQLVASYTYLRSKGLLASGRFGPRTSQVTSLGSDFGQNPNDFVNAGGLLLADRPHTFKVQLVAELPFGFLVGANYLLQSGRTWGREMRVPGLGFPNAPVIQMEERDGSRRLSSHNILALRLQKSFKLPKNVAFVLFGDVLNVLNEDAHQGVLSRIGDAPNYAFADGFVLPRRAMLGAKLTF